MRKLVAALWFMLATGPFALAQDKATETPKKAPSAKQQA